MHTRAGHHAAAPLRADPKNGAGDCTASWMADALTREEWNEVLAVEPATPNQQGAVMREFDRLGFGDDERVERLAVCGRLLRLDEPPISTRDLTMGQAGCLVGILTRCRSRDDLPSPPLVSQPSACPGPAALLAVTLYKVLAARGRPDGSRDGSDDDGAPGAGKGSRV